MKKALLIINNKTRKLNESYTFQIVCKLAKADYMCTIYPLQDNLDVDLNNYLENNNYDLVVTMGGDGTLNHTINSLIKNKIDCPIGYIPAGTTNDFAKNLNITDDVDQAVDVIVNGKVTYFDLGHFNDSFFNYVACFGAFSDISYSTDQSLKNTFGYGAYGLTALANLPSNLSARCHMRFETDKGIFEDDYIFGSICNSTSVAGMKLRDITNEDLHDGLFELLLIKRPENASEIAEIFRSVINKDFSNPYCLLTRIKKAKIYSNENIYWTLDGESGGCPDVIDFSVIENGVRIIVK